MADPDHSEDEDRFLLLGLSARLRLLVVCHTYREEDEVIRTSLSTQESTTKAEEKAKLPGALEVTLTHKAEPQKVRISLDKESPVEFLGQVWSQLNIAPGQHLLSVQTLSDPSQTIERVIEVAPGSVARVEVKFVS